jgi:hypothetical protein
MVLNCPIRRWDEKRRDFVDFDDWHKLAGPPPGAETLGIGPGLAEWEVNAEVLLDSGASRDFVNKRTVTQRGWKIENASHAIDVQVADGRVLTLDKVAAVELQLAPGLLYRTKAYVMPMGGALDAILGMTWWQSWEVVKFYGKHNPKQVKVTMDGREFTLTGKTVQEEQESMKFINDHMRDLGFEHEIISAEQGAADLQELEVLAREAAKNGNTEAAMPYLFRLAQLNELEEEGTTPSGAVEQWREQAYLLARPKTNGQFTAELCGVSQELQREGKRTLLHVDASKAIPRVTLINADDAALMEEENQRESLYPFGNEEITEVNAVKRQPPATTINSKGHQQLVHDILSGVVNT